MVKSLVDTIEQELHTNIDYLILETEMQGKQLVKVVTQVELMVHL